MSGQIIRNFGRDVNVSNDGDEYVEWLNKNAPDNEPPRRSAVNQKVDARTAEMNKDKLESIVAGYGSPGRITDTVLANGYLYVYFDRRVPDEAREDMANVAGQVALPTDDPNVIAFKLEE